jgi:hypothetical protein
MYCITAKLMG